MNLNNPKILNIIDYWIDEDIGSGDLTSPAVTNSVRKAEWIAKEKGIFCGGEIIRKVFEKLDPKVEINLLIDDGDKFKPNQKIINFVGPAKSLLAGERISLNIAMHLSGISSYTYKIIELLKGTKISLADTRKTTPGLRLFEKYAFKCGGGKNHRMGLYDSAMLKENHIAWQSNSNLSESIKTIRLNSPFTTFIIVEAENLNQAKDAVIAGADGILLDEIDPNTIRNGINELRYIGTKTSDHRRKRNLIIEVSGINPDKIDNYLIDGIDFISTSSSVTKSKWIDLSMRYIN